MPSLRDIQLAFSREIFREPGVGISESIRGNGFSGAERVEVYRNNVYVGLAKTLRSVYPVVEQLVGEGFFRYAAAEYIGRHPSVSGDLHEFGDAFPTFLSTFTPAAEMAYLPDVAHLEWAYYKVFHAAEHAPLDLAALGAAPQDRYEELKFKLHPASRLVASDYPVLHIWRVNQKNYSGDQTVDLSEGGVKLLVIRRDFDIQIQTLEAAEYALLYALAGNHNFATACEQALAMQADYDVASGFRKHVVQGTLVDFYL